MNKEFPDTDEDDSLITAESFGGITPDEKELEDFAAPFSKIENEVDLPETHEPETLAPNASESREAANETLNLESKDLSTVQSAAQKNDSAPFAEVKNEAANVGFDDAEFDVRKTQKRSDDYPIFAQSPYQSESSDETIRKSGLAYTAAIVLFASIVFTLILGWFADLLFGTSPWGKVGGIVIGAVIGFIQFFRTTSQLIKNKD